MRRLSRCNCVQEYGKSPYEELGQMQTPRGIQDKAILGFLTCQRSDCKQHLKFSAFELFTLHPVMQNSIELQHPLVPMCMQYSQHARTLCESVM